MFTRYTLWLRQQPKRFVYRRRLKRRGIDYVRRYRLSFQTHERLKWFLLAPMLPWSVTTNESALSTCLAVGNPVGYLSDESNERTLVNSLFVLTRRNEILMCQSQTGSQNRTWRDNEHMKALDSCSFSTPVDHAMVFSSTVDPTRF